MRIKSKSSIKLFCLLLFCVNVLSGQTLYSLRGRVVDNGKSLDYFTVTLSSLSDSLILYSGAFVEGQFEFVNLQESGYILHISCLGYIPVVKTIEFKETSTDLGDIFITEDPVKLQEITIAASRSLFRQEKGQIIVNVSETPLSNAGSLVDVLKKSPGVIVDHDNKIQIFGKGTPVIFINDQQIISNNELESLLSNDIDKIEVDRNPSARYAASGHAVVRIITKKSKTDRLSVTLFDNITLSRRLSNTTGIQLSHKGGSWTNLLSYSFTNSNHKDFSNTYEVNTLPCYVIHNNGEITSNYSNNIHRFYSGNEYFIHTGHTIGFQLSGSYDLGNELATTNQSIEKTDRPLILKVIDQNKTTTRNLLNASLNYQWENEEDKLFFVLGYANMKKLSDSRIEEKLLSGTGSSLFRIDNDNEYNVYSATLDYQFNLKNFMKISSGVKYSQVINDGSSYQWDMLSSLGIYSHKSNINDKIMAAYISSNKEIGKFTLSAGVRFEQTSSRTTVENTIIDTVYRNCFPSFLAEYAQSENVNLSVSYSRRISRPGFSQINPDRVYFDSLSYSIGNPFLRPEYSDNMELNLVIHDFRFSAGYTQKKDFIIYTAENDDVNPDVTKWTYFNINRSQTVFLGVVYYKAWKNYTINAEAYVNKPFVEVTYLNSIIKRNQPTYFFSLSNHFNIKKNLTFNCDFSYQSEGNDGITYWDSSCNLSAGILWKVYKNRLHLSLNINDILKTDKSNCWEDRYGNIITGMKSDRDTRYVRLGIKFIINDMKNNIKGRFNNNEELNRL
jgi:outer membrane receptor protein involved in Fe transport